MLRTLSYVNLIFAVGYFLAYLQNSSPQVITGLLSVVIFNWLVLRRLEKNNWRQDIWWWILAVASLGFSGYISYGAIALLLDAADFQYYPSSILILSGSGLLLTISVIFHLFLSFSKINWKKDE